MTHIPDLPVSDQLVEQRRVLKFWLERCQQLEKENEQLKEKVRSFYG